MAINGRYAPIKEKERERKAVCSQFIYYSIFLSAVQLSFASICGPARADILGFLPLLIIAAAKKCIHMHEKYR